MKYNQEKWNEVKEVLTQLGPNYNILEEQIDIITQREFIKRRKIISKFDQELKSSLKKDYIEHINDLFSNIVSNDIKKDMLIVLSGVEDVAVYRAIENFSKEDSPIKNWAIIALQQNRMLLLTSLQDDPGVFISSGLGGIDSRLRFFCVFPFKKDKTVEDFQKKLFLDEAKLRISNADGIIEKFNSNYNFITLTILLHVETDIKTMLDDLIKECNKYGDFINKNMIVTNVKILSTSEIKHILKTINTD